MMPLDRGSILLALQRAFVLDEITAGEIFYCKKESKRTPDFWKDMKIGEEITVDIIPHLTPLRLRPKEAFIRCFLTTEVKLRNP